MRERSLGRRFAWLFAIACAACCVAPMATLAGVVVLAGAAVWATIASAPTPLFATAVVATLTVLWWWRGRTRSCSCADGKGC